MLVNRIEEARQVANRKRDDRQKRREKNRRGCRPHHGRCPELNAAGPNGFPGRLQACGFNPALEIHDLSGRPFKICDGEPISAILG